MVPCHRFNVQHTSKVYEELVQCRGSHNSQNTRLLRKLYMLIVTCDPEPQLDTRYDNCVSSASSWKSQQICAR